MSQTEEERGPLIWVDLEMSGLNPDQDVILEVAALATDQLLQPISEFGEVVIGHRPELFDLMDSWNQEHHVKSGLWQRVTTSQVTISQVENDLLTWLKSLSKAKTSPLCGNSIWQDRRFICRHLPAVDSFLHYRMVDVSSIKELALRWYPQLKAYPKKSSHRAMDDILESIDELRYFRKHLLKDPKDVLSTYS